MKILIVTPYYHPKIGGLENYVYHLVQSLLKDCQFQIVVVTANHEKSTNEENIIDDRYKVYRLPIQFKISNTPVSFHWYKQMEEIIAKEKPDIINAHAPVPFIADITSLAARDKPFILTYHAGSMLKGKMPVDLLIKLYENTALKKLFNRSHKIICYSKEFIANYLAPYKNKVTYIPPGVDKHLYSPNNHQEISRNILYVGKLEKSAQWKGVRYLLEAIQILKSDFPDIKLSLVGEGDAISEYQNYAKKLYISENVIFTGPLQGEQLAQQYRNSYALVLPSISSAESFGIVLIEAMASGLPVIGSNRGGIPGVIDDNVNGILVTPRNPQSIADAIKKLLNDPEYARKLGRQGRMKVMKEFVWDNNAEKFKKIVYELT